MDVLYVKFEQMLEDQSRRSSKMSYHIIDEEKVDFVNGKIRVERKSGLKIVEELDSKSTGKVYSNTSSY